MNNTQASTPQEQYYISFTTLKLFCGFVHVNALIFVSNNVVCNSSVTTCYDIIKKWLFKMIRQYSGSQNTKIIYDSTKSLSISTEIDKYANYGSFQRCYQFWRENGRGREKNILSHPDC